MGFHRDFMEFYSLFLGGLMGLNGIYDGYTLVISYAMRTGQSEFLTVNHHVYHRTKWAMASIAF